MNVSRQNAEQQNSTGSEGDSPESCDPRLENSISQGQISSPNLKDISRATPEAEQKAQFEQKSQTAASSHEVERSLGSINSLHIDERLQQELFTQDFDLINQVVNGKYHIDSLVGQGGMGCVYRAKNLLTMKVVALKVLHAHLLKADYARKRFQHEAIAASRLNHPNAITIWDMGFIDDNNLQPYITMDYLEGRSLADEVRQQGALGVKRSLHVFIQACAALDHAHRHGIVHRDLKPSNIMLIEVDGDSDFVKVVDFGIAKIIDIDSRLTQTGDIFGSPAYMSPEQCQGVKDKMDARSDIYSMGCLMYEALTGKPPFEGSNVLDTMFKQTNEAPAGLGDIDADIRMVKKLEQIVLKALAKNPNDRFQTMLELQSALENAERYRARGLKVFATLSMQLSKQKRRLENACFGSRERMRRTVLSSIVGLILVIIVVMSYIAWSQNIPEPTLAERIVPLQDYIRNDLEHTLEKKLDTYHLIKGQLRMGNAAAATYDGFIFARNYAILLTEAGQYGNAEQAFMEAEHILATAGIPETPDSCADLHAGLAECYQKLNNLQLAKLEGDRALKLYGLIYDTMELHEYFGKLIKGMARLGEIMDQMGDWYAAREQFHKVLICARDPKYREDSKRNQDKTAFGYALTGNFYLKEALRQLGHSKPSSSMQIYDVKEALSNANQLYNSAITLWSKDDNATKHNQEDPVRNYNVATVLNQLALSEMLSGDVAENAVDRRNYYKSALTHSQKAELLLANSHYESYPIYTKADIYRREGHGFEWIMNYIAARQRAVNTRQTRHPD